MKFHTVLKYYFLNYFSSSNSSFKPFNTKIKTPIDKIIVNILSISIDRLANPCALNIQSIKIKFVMQYPANKAKNHKKSRKKNFRAYNFLIK